jgi:hypothetical protein
MSSALTCRDESRRQRIREHGHNGIDYVDVTGKHLCVHFLTGIPAEFLPKEKGKALTPGDKDLALRHIVIRGGRRVTDIVAIDFDPHDTDDTFDQDCLGIELDREGDWSTYTLCFVELDCGRPTDIPLKSLDPRYACVDFSFKIDCPAEIDCKSDDACPPPARTHPSISYLAKDYETFRRLILDRLALLMPDWRERHVPDIGIAIVELLAYVGDYLSYYQDAVGTEAYLDTARQRISVRRHARLVDYRMHDGCNARAFVFLHVTKDGELPLASLYFVTRFSEIVTQTVLQQHEVDAARGWLAYEPLDARAKFPVWRAHNEIRIYTWGDRECCINKGATRATLVDGYAEEPPPPEEPEYPEKKPRRRGRHYQEEEEEDYCPPPEEPKEPPRILRLQPGDFLLFEELACAGTVYRKDDEQEPGDETDEVEPWPDADRTHRHVVRLTRVTPLVDPLDGQPVLDVEWDREDAMPFMLCVSAIGTAPQCDYVEPLAVARGNILLTDQGQTVHEDLDPIPEQPQDEVCEGEDDPSEFALLAGRYRPALKNAPLTFVQPLIKDAPAAVLLRQLARAAVPAARLESVAPRIHGGEPHETWTPRYDLLDSGPEDNDFVAEVDDDGRAQLRFGDGELGRAIETAMTFSATYRVGNGRAGLVGAESIVHVVFREGTNDLIDGVRNPLPSTGASDPEPVAEVKMLAPRAFRKDLQRAITGEDYATLAKYLRYPVRNPRVQGSAGALVWTGSWYEAGVAVDAFGSATLDDWLRAAIEGSLARYRRMGHDLRVGGARSIPLRVRLDLCIKPQYLRAHVLAAVRDALKRLFAPDNLTFGESVYVSRIVAAVMAVDGIAEVHVAQLERLANVSQGTAAPESGVLKLAPDEIARLDNDPVAPENGILTFGYVRGGR